MAGLRPLGGNFCGRPEVWAHGDQRHLIVRDLQNRLAHEWSDATHDWSAWESASQTGRVKSNASAVGYVGAWPVAFLSVLYRNAEHKLAVVSYQNSIWIPERPLDGVLVGDPCAVSWESDRVDVFARGTDDQLWHRWFVNLNAAGESSGPWEPLGGVIFSDPVAVSPGLNRIIIAARDGASRLFIKRWDPGWSDWVAVATECICKPSLAYSIAGPGAGIPEYLWVAGLNYQSEVFVKRMSVSGTEAPVDARSIAGLKAGAPPVAVCWGPGRLDLFAVTTNGQLMHSWAQEIMGFGTTFQPWETLGTGVLPDLCVVAPSTERLDIYAQDMYSGSVLRKSYVGSAGWDPHYP